MLGIPIMLYHGWTIRCCVGCKNFGEINAIFDPYYISLV